MVTQQAAIETVKDFVREVKGQGVHLRHVFLYGSVSRNTQHEHSDIDVALVSDQFSGVGFLDIPLFVKALRKHYIIQPKTFSTKDFENGDAFAEEIKKTGMEIKL